MTVPTYEGSDVVFEKQEDGTKIARFVYCGMYGDTPILWEQDSLSGMLGWTDPEGRQWVSLGGPAHLLHREG